MNAVEIESEAATVKAVLVKLGISAREKKPEHEMTRLIAEAENSIYRIAEELQRLRMENEQLKRSFEVMETLGDEYDETTEEVEIVVPEQITDEEWSSKQLTTRDKPNF